MLGGSSSLQVTSTVLLARGNGIKNSRLDLDSVLLKTHVSQHHDRGKQQSGGVGKTLASDIGGRSVDSLKDRNLVTHVARGSQTQTTNETGGKIGQNVTVKVGHDHDVLLVRSRVGDETQTGAVDELGLESDLGVLLGNLVGSGQEQTVGNLHNGGLVDGQDLGLANQTGVLKGVSEDTLRGLLGDKLDGLDDTRNNDVLDTRVLTLGVLTDEDGVDIIVRGLVTYNRLTRTDVGKQVESSSESQVKRNMALSNRSGQGSLKGNKVLANRVDGGFRDSSLSVNENRSNVNRFPLNGDLGCLVNILDSL